MLVHLSVPLIGSGGDSIFHALDTAVEVNIFFMNMPHGVFGSVGVRLIKILFRRIFEGANGAGFHQGRRHNVENQHGPAGEHKKAYYGRDAHPEWTDAEIFCHAGAYAQPFGVSGSVGAIFSF